MWCSSIAYCRCVLRAVLLYVVDMDIRTASEIQSKEAYLCEKKDISISKLCVFSSFESVRKVKKKSIIIIIIIININIRTKKKSETKRKWKAVH